MRVGNQHSVDGRQIADEDAGTPLATKQDQPGREYGVNQHRAACYLDQEGRVPNEGDSSVRGTEASRPVELSLERLLMTLADETPELASLSHPKWNVARHLLQT
jgi:hypothetical protein